MVYFDNLKADSRNVTKNGTTFATKPDNQYFIIFLSKIQTPVDYKGCDFFFSILLQPDPAALSDGRIWLFGFHPCFFQHGALCMRSTPRQGLPAGPGPNGLPCTVQSCHFRSHPGAKKLSRSMKPRMQAPPTGTVNKGP